MFPLPEAGAAASGTDIGWIIGSIGGCGYRVVAGGAAQDRAAVHWILLVSVLTFIATVVAAWAAVKAL
jgi:hypothetical protein